jgi:hypothetical protein
MLTKRDLFVVINAIATIDIAKIDAGDRYEINKLEDLTYKAATMIEKLQFEEIES